MQIFMVGGAVRDELLGLPVQDRDFVVVGASPEAMLAKGFKPVGKDFPVLKESVKCPCTSCWRNIQGRITIAAPAV